MKRMPFTAFLAVLAAVAAPLAIAQTGPGGFPAKPIRLVVPQTPGGGSDIISRIVAQKLAERIGQPVVVENRAGAGGNIGSEAVAKSPPDGYTLVTGFVGTHAINPALYANAGFDPIKDFAPVAVLAIVPFVLVANPQFPVNSVKELVAYAKANPGKVNYASAGNGTVNHLVGEMLKTTTGIQMAHVPYKGASPALTDVVSGAVPLMWTSLPSAMPFIKSGRVKAIAVTSGARSVSMPDLPTMAESGGIDFDVKPWFGILAPAGTPKDVVAYLNREINAVLAQPDTREKLAAQGAEPAPMSPEQFAEILATDVRKWAQVVKESGAKVD